MGHGHPKILKAAVKALEDAAVVNLPFHNEYYGSLAKKLHEVRSPGLSVWEVSRRGRRVEHDMSRQTNLTDICGTHSSFLVTTSLWP